MLHTNQSQKKNVLKYAFILPALVGFMLLFQVETVAQVKENSQNKSTEAVAVAIGFVTDKNATNEEMKIDTEELKKQGIDYKFSKVKRNNKGEIIAIKVEFNDNKGTKGVKELKGKEPIEPIYFSSENGQIGFTSQPDLSDYIIDEKLSKKFGTEIKVKKVSVNGVENKSIGINWDGAVKISESQELPNYPTNNPLYIINGKEYLHRELSKMNIINADKLTLLNKEEAIAKYGDKGKNGVLVIEGNCSFEIDGETVSFEEPKGTTTNELEVSKKEKELKAQQNSKLSKEQIASRTERRTNMELSKKEREIKAQQNSKLSKEEIEDRIEKKNNMYEGKLRFTTIIETENGNQTVIYDFNQLKIPGSPSVKIDKIGPSIYVNGKVLSNPEAFLKMDPKQIYYIEATDKSADENGVIKIKRIDVKTK